MNERKKQITKNEKKDAKKRLKNHGIGCFLKILLKKKSKRNVNEWQTPSRKKKKKKKNENQTNKTKNKPKTKNDTKYYKEKKVRLSKSKRIIYDIKIE